MSRALLATVALVSLLGASTPAAAQDLDEARRLYLAADFRGAQEAFEAVLDGASIDRETAAVAHVHLAALASMFDDDELAREHAAAALSLDPDIASPEGTPAGFSDLLAEVAVAPESAEASLEIERVGDLRLRARLTPPIRLLAAELSLACESAGGELLAETSAPPPEVFLSLPAGVAGALRCRAEARNPGGASLFDAALERTGLGPTADDGAGDDDDGGDEVGPGRRYLWLWITLSVVVVAAVLAPVLAVTLADDRVLLNGTTVEGW